MNILQRAISLTRRGTMLLTLGIFLGVIALIDANIVVRLCGSVIQGAFELVQLMMVEVIAISLAYTTLEKGHVVIGVVLSRLPQRTKTIIEVFTSVISTGLWAAIFWRSFLVMYERGLAEHSQQLEIIYLPFRCLWLSGLGFLCLILLIDLYKTLKEAMNT